MRSSVKCLLVDDLEENLVALGALLEQDGVQLLKARSGSEALELLLIHDFALALLDVQMPDIDGFQLAEFMRGSERTRNIPIIFVTAGTHEPHRVFKGYETGAVDFLHKPVDPLILANKASVFFQLYRQKLQLAEDLKERTETLRLNEMFVAILGHDLRTPLNTILTCAETLLKANDDVPVRDAADRIQSSGRRMRTLIENVLDLARARLAGGIALKYEHVEFDRLVAATVTEHQALAPLSSIDVKLHGDLRGEWDSDRLAQVLSNLVGNALQHGESGQPVLVLLDGAQADTVTLTVANAGSISADSLPHVFDPFGGGRRQRARSEGLGLGLYIVRQIVEAHGGEIGVHVEGEQRTVFRVALPRRREHLNAVAPQEEDRGAFRLAPGLPATLADATVSKVALRILVVDDNHDSADSLAILLEMDGNQTRTAYDGLEALQVGSEFEPDVVVLDLGLPKLDGYQAARRIREKPWGRDIALIALTGWDDEDDRQKTREAGFDRHMVKPIDSVALQKILAELTRGTATA
jgi:two-component system sensor histidine kinase/response regulator